MSIGGNIIGRIRIKYKKIGVREWKKGKFMRIDVEDFRDVSGSEGKEIIRCKEES